MNYLGLDYGTKHIGVALATGPLAEPLITIPPSKALKLIAELVKKYDISEIVIGQPDKVLKLEFKKFVNYLLAKRETRFEIVNCELKIVDETLSSMDARQSLLHTTQKRRRTGEHSAAASIILQNWLDSKG